MRPFQPFHGEVHLNSVRWNDSGVSYLLDGIPLINGSEGARLAQFR
jgi:hypothetical protein